MNAQCKKNVASALSFVSLGTRGSHNCAKHLTIYIRLLFLLINCLNDSIIWKQSSKLLTTTRDTRSGVIARANLVSSLSLDWQLIDHKRLRVNRVNKFQLTYALTLQRNLPWITPMHNLQCSARREKESGSLVDSTGVAPSVKQTCFCRSVNLFPATPTGFSIFSLVLFSDEILLLPPFFFFFFHFRRFPFRPASSCVLLCSFLDEMIWSRDREHTDIYSS